MNTELTTREQFRERMAEMSHQHLNELEALWSQMGVPEEQRMETVQEYIHGTFQRMIKEEKGHLDQILKQIQLLEQERQGLLKELNQPDKGGDKYDSLSYVEILKDLEETKKVLTEEKEERMVEVNYLRKVDEDASAALEMESYPLPPKSLPSVKQMMELKGHIEEMKNLKKERSVSFDNLKSEILSLYEEMETEPNTTIERRLICGAKDEILLSSTNLNMMEKMLCTLHNNFEDNKTKITKSMERIDVLCNRLNIDDNERKKYLSNNHTGYSSRLVKEVSSKLEELEHMKLSYLSQFVSEARKEINEHWVKCLYGDSQKKAFTFFYSKDIDEELLNAHEKEIERLKMYMEANGHLFEKFERWEQLRNKKAELDEKEKDPNRLFNRRRNNLAQEEVERKRIKKQLPKFERELFELVEEHDSKNENKFMIHGLPFVEYMQLMKVEHGEESEFEKVQKKDMKKKLIEHETIFGSIPRKALTPMNATTALSKTRQLDPFMNAGVSTAKKSASAESCRQASAIKRPLPMTRNMKTAQSNQKPPFPVKKVVPGNQQIGSRPKRMRMIDNSIISGNLQDTVTSIGSSTSYKEPCGSSTFCMEPKLRPMKGTLKMPTLAESKSSTPINRKYLKTPEKQTFKTPSSIPRSTLGILKSGRKIPFKI